VPQEKLDLIADHHPAMLRTCSAQQCH